MQMSVWQHTRYSPDRLKEKTHSHGVSGSAGGKSLLLCQPPQPNGFFYGRCDRPIDPASARARDRHAQAQMAQSLRREARVAHRRLHQRANRDGRFKPCRYRCLNEEGSTSSLDAISYRIQASRKGRNRYILLQIASLAQTSILCFVGERWTLLNLRDKLEGWNNTACRSHQAPLKISRVGARPYKFASVMRGVQYRQGNGGDCVAVSSSPIVLRTIARAYLGRVEEKSSRYAKARVQIPNNPAGWLNTQAWGLAVASMGIRYIRGDAEDLPLPAFGVGGGFKVKNIKGG